MSYTARSVLSCFVLIMMTSDDCTCHGFSIVSPYSRGTVLPSTTSLSSIMSETVSAATEVMNKNGESHQDPLYAALASDVLLNVTLNETDVLPLAPQVFYDKFITMQDKRVVVTIRYSEHSGLRPYFLTVVKKLKTSNPDVAVERRILPVTTDAEATFEIMVDGTVVVGNKSRTRRQKVARVDMSHARSVFVSMQELDVAISRARRRRRPTTVYGDELALKNRDMMDDGLKRSLD
jgi:hypothetical protein